VANITVNSANTIQFVNGPGKETAETPTAIFQVGDWDAGSYVESGIMVDVGGAEAPLLSAANARKLAKWLTRAADLLEQTGNSSSQKKRNKYLRDEDDEEF
jgi:hypothetical protein